MTIVKYPDEAGFSGKVLEDILAAYIFEKYGRDIVRGSLIAYNEVTGCAIKVTLKDE
jgi:hypothetical protein